MKLCSVDGCERRHSAHGLCKQHAQRRRRGRELGGPFIRDLGDRFCSIPSCLRLYYAKGMCQVHYDRTLRGALLHSPIMVKEKNGPDAHCRAGKCRRPIKAKGLCSLHYQRRSVGLPMDIPPREERRPFGKGRWLENGYVMLRVPVDTPGAKKMSGNLAGAMHEHRYLIQTALNRPLRREENVHHVNGDKQDNSLSNLELWTKAQPAGQRVTDKVAFAVQLLTTYPSFTGLDLADQAILLSILSRTKA